MTITAVSEDAIGVRVEATAPLTHLCPFKDEVDSGKVRIVWETWGSTLELHALRDHLRRYAAWRVSHEQITNEIKNRLLAVRGINVLLVETTWNTAGMEVLCSTSPTHADPVF